METPTVEIVQMNALVYGFGPYGKFVHNVTTDIIRSVNRMKRAKGMVFDVRFNQKQFIEALERYRPEMVIGLGQHPRARKIRIERRARNWQASSSTVGKRIERSGPEYCYVSLKIPATEGATVTYDAGDYVCNYSMYVMCRETEKTGAKYAFLHVPLNVDVEKATELIGKILSRQESASLSVRTRRRLAGECGSPGRRSLPLRIKQLTRFSVSRNFPSATLLLPQWAHAEASELLGSFFWSAKRICCSSFSHMSDQSLQDKVVIIVGASSGMGKATAISFSKAGAKLALAARNESALNELSSELGGDTLVCPLDARDVDAIENLIRQTLQSFGRIDVLIYATGTNIPDRSLEKLTYETWEMMLAVNATGAFNCTKAVLPTMQSQKEGLIIYISSVSAKRADVSGVSYQASKHALTGLAHGTYLEQKGNGIRTSLIMPGLCDTPLVQQRPVPPSDAELKKALQPQDVADACLYVAAAPSRARIGELVLEPAGL